MNIYGNLLILIVFLFTSNPAWSDADKPRHNKELTGAWQLILDISQTTDTPAFIPEKITLLSNFTQDGAFLSSTDLPTLNVPWPSGNSIAVKIGDGHGIWKHMGNGEYILKTKRLVQLAVPPESLVGFANATAWVWFDHHRKDITGIVELQLETVGGEKFPPAFGDVTGYPLFNESSKTTDG